jgi:hypothetical protein
LPEAETFFLGIGFTILGPDNPRLKLELKMKTYALFLILFIAPCLFSQEVKSKIEDFNNDGVMDTMEWYYDGGSGFGGWTCSIVNGKTNELHEIINWGCFCDIQRTVLIPPALRLPENYPFLDQIKGVLFTEHQDEPDLSFQWIIDGYAANVQAPKNSRFNRLIFPTLNWVKGEIQLPTNYSIDMKGLPLHQIYSTDMETPDWYDAEENEGWVYYYGSRHGRIEALHVPVLINSTTTRKIYKTAHGLIQEKDGAYAWIFVTDFTLTGGPEKMRWGSIVKTEIVGDHLILQHGRMPNLVDALYIINLSNGECGQLDLAINDFSVEEGSLNYVQYDETGSMSLNELFIELEAQRISFIESH